VAGWIEWVEKQARGQIAAVRGLDIKKKGRVAKAPPFKHRAAAWPLKSRRAAELVRA